MKDCRQFSGTLDFFFTSEEITDFINHYFRDFDFKDKWVLDVGCRNGGITKSLFQKGATAIGIDINREAIKKAKLENSGPQFYFADVLNLEKFKDCTFDVILCFGILPYIEPVKINQVLLEFIRVLKPGGKIILTFQKEKSPLFIFLVRVFNLFPNLFGPILIMLGLFYFQTLNFKYIKYALCEGLKGINFGYPKILENFEIPTPDCRIISSKYSKSFLLEKCV